MPSPPRTTRRALLRLAALAPLAAGCAAVKLGPPPADPVAGPTPAAGGPDPLEAVRAFPLPPEAEPATVFRAAAPSGRGA